ncbi:MAG: hypothetical protein WCR08_08130 [Gammaproteobacteria bacterium]
MKNSCNPGSKNCSRIIGAIFLIVGSGLTLLTHSEAGILGFFIAGAILCMKPRSGCNPCGGCGDCGCCCPCPTGKDGAVLEAHCDSMPKVVVKAPKSPKAPAKPRKAKKPA